MADALSLLGGGGWESPWLVTYIAGWSQRGFPEYVCGAAAFRVVQRMLVQRLSAVLKQGGHGNSPLCAREISDRTSPPSVCVDDAATVLPHDARL